MNLDETTDELDARTRMATALQTLGHHLVGHRVEPDLADRVAAIAESLTADVATRPSRNRTAEIAALTGMSIRTIRRWIADETLPSIKLSGARLVAIADLQAVLSRPQDSIKDILDDREQSDDISDN